MQVSDIGHISKQTIAGGKPRRASLAPPAPAAPAGKPEGGAS
jgi:hypothetical protein